MIKIKKTKKITLQEFERMTGNEIALSLLNIANQGHDIARRLKQNAILKAESEANYRVALAKKIIELKHEKYPATLIGDLARGDEKISMLKLERDKYEGLQTGYKMQLMIIQHNITVGQSVLNWKKTDFQYSNITNT